MLISDNSLPIAQMQKCASQLCGNFEEINKYGFLIVLIKQIIYRNRRESKLHFLNEELFKISTKLPFNCILFMFRGLIEKPPVGGKELTLLNQLQLTGFRLHPGPLPEQYRYPFPLLENSI